MDDRMTSEVLEKKKLKEMRGGSEFIFCLLEEFDANFC